MLAKSKIRLPGSIHIQAHRLSHSLGKLLGVHFLLVAKEGIVEVRENKWLVLAELKHWLLLFLNVTIFAVGSRASSRAADTDHVH